MPVKEKSEGSAFGLFFYANLGIIYDIGDGNLPHFILHSLLNRHQLVIEGGMDISPDRASLTGVFVEMEELATLDALNGVVDVEEGNLVKWLRRRSSPTASGNCDEPCGFELL